MDFDFAVAIISRSAPSVQDEEHTGFPQRVPSSMVGRIRKKPTGRDSGRVVTRRRLSRGGQVRGSTTGEAKEARPNRREPRDRSNGMRQMAARGGASTGTSE
ncbi:hypothetical protein E4U43_008722 [Claviceps pusilla]|uniref:Uncharacterized protein n=1 Tax=Claviceps pusilla TaxID=123648 RepID=A0A9P7NAX5_9HYPO|nr:hypothetical protein E4U43_008722 [Claviceps pusilla]